MPYTHVALFRAVNVGGHGLLSMGDLRTFLAAAGLGDARTVLQSGNAVFDGGRRTSRSIEGMIEREARTRQSITTEVFVRSVSEWEAALEANPFVSAAASAPARLIMMVMRDRPAAAAVRTLQQAIVGPEQLQSIDHQLYVVYPEGQGTSKLTGAVIEKALNTRGTARNWNTVLRIAALFAGSRDA